MQSDKKTKRGEELVGMKARSMKMLRVGRERR